MIELFKKLKKLDFTKKKLVLLDTCFLVYTFKHHNEKELEDLCKMEKVAMTSFNAEEYNHIHHKLEEHIRSRIRKFLKKKMMHLLPIYVHPGERQKEIEFINATDPYLFADCPDNSDGVLMACAIKTKSTVLTRDRHDLFTTKLENYLKKYGISVHNDLKSVI